MRSDRRKQTAFLITYHSSLFTFLLVARGTRAPRADSLGLDNAADSHPVERAPDEEGRDEEEDGGQDVVDRVVAAAAENRERQLDREQAEERRELDDRVHRHRRSEEHTSELQSHSFISYAVFCL